MRGEPRLRACEDAGLREVHLAKQRHALAEQPRHVALHRARACRAAAAPRVVCACAHHPSEPLWQKQAACLVRAGAAAKALFCVASVGMSALESRTWVSRKHVGNNACSAHLAALLIQRRVATQQSWLKSVMFCPMRTSRARAAVVTGLHDLCLGGGEQLERGMAHGATLSTPASLTHPINNPAARCTLKSLCDAHLPSARRRRRRAARPRPRRRRAARGAERRQGAAHAARGG